MVPVPKITIASQLNWDRSTDCPRDPRKRRECDRTGVAEEPEARTIDALSAERRKKREVLPIWVSIRIRFALTARPPRPSSDPPRRSGR